MSEIQIYYNAPINIINNLKKQELDIDPIVRSGYKTFDEIKGGIKQYGNFCRDEESITINHLVGTMASSVILYAILNEKIVGLLVFMFNTNKKGDKIINFDGICSPEEFKGLGIGQQLIDTLIRIGKFNDIKYIDLECKGSNLMKYYKNKFGFVVSSQKTTYDSDAESDDEGEPYYYMTLDLSTVSGGKKRTKRKTDKQRKTKKNKKSKRKQTKKR